MMSGITGEGRMPQPGQMNDHTGAAVSELQYARILGRTNGETDPLTLFWHGSGLEVKVRARELWVQVKTEYDEYEVWVSVWMDGALTARQPLPSGQYWLPLLLNADPQTEHTMRLIRETQPVSGDDGQLLQIRKVWTDGEFLPLPEPKIRIEFIGDSMTSGEGTVGADQEMQWNSTVMSAAYAYPLRTAMALDGECRIISEGGWGVFCSWDGNARAAIPKIYGQVCGSATGERLAALGAGDPYDFTSWKPDVVFINLGANDAGAFDQPPAYVWEETGELLDQRRLENGAFDPECIRRIQEAAVTFLQTVRRCNPQARILWGFGALTGDLTASVTEAVRRYARDYQDGNIRLIRLPEIHAGNTGSRSHPGRKWHQEVTQLLCGELGGAAVRSTDAREDVSTALTDTASGATAVSGEKGTDSGADKDVPEKDADVREDADSTADGMDAAGFFGGIVRLGDTRRLEHFLAHVQSGGRATVAFLGGSITQGSLSSAPERCYARRTFDRLQALFPEAPLTFVNAGIGGTDSQFGAARVNDDVLSFEPDLVFVEFSVNDENNRHYRETYEGLIRRLLQAPSQPAVVLIHSVYYQDGHNAQEMHDEIGRYYNLPAVSVKDSIYRYMIEEQLPLETFTPDGLHPNDRGHQMMADLVMKLIGAVYGRMGEAAGTECAAGPATWADAAAPAQQAAEGAFRGKTAGRADGSVRQLPPPLTVNGYEDSFRLNNRTGVPAEVSGFVADPREPDGVTDRFVRGWKAERKGDQIVFEVEGRCIGVQLRQTILGPAPVAEAVLDGDEEHPIRLDANFDETWGDHLKLITLAEHLPDAAGDDPLRHRVLIRIVKEASGIAAERGDVRAAMPFELISVIVSQKGQV